MSADLCLCISAIPEFLQTNLIAIAAVAIAGKPVVTGVLTGLVRHLPHLRSNVFSRLTLNAHLD